MAHGFVAEVGNGVKGRGKGRVAVAERVEEEFGPGAARILG